ncbi:MAG: hypothetical protein V4857_28625 [Pseudomonadota bacterium]
MKRTVLRLLLPLLAAMAPQAFAGQLASLAIVDQQTGEQLQIWRHGGHNYVVGQPGQRYALRVTNKTGGRLLSVLAVDGVNVITGATASPAQSGYVLHPGQQETIAGWRKNMHEVAAFYFTNVTDSYAARTGRAHQAGVIGAALYLETPPVHYEAPMAPPMAEAQSSARDAGTSNGAVAAPSSAPRAVAREERAHAPRYDSKLGTGHGERLDSATSMTEFRRASTRPSETLVVYYDSLANLRARGIIPRVPVVRNRPAPFPGGFVPDPS